MKKHDFTPKIIEILKREHGQVADDLLKQSELLRYLNRKTKSASRGSKARGSFANLYAIYVLVEDYIDKGYVDKEGYADYEGARFMDLFKRQRELPFGSKLQNHALNHRMNQEFQKYYSDCEHTPIVRDPETARYWFNENLLRVEMAGEEYNLAKVTVGIIDAYIAAKKSAHEGFIETIEEMLKLKDEGEAEVNKFIESQIQPNVDARVFEIVSYAVLKAYYSDRSIFWGWSKDELNEEYLVLYKTGRTNANDGGIDFVMKPLGRFFQVTETTDVKKYFLDIDKVLRFPITFVVKTAESESKIKARIKEQAESLYAVGKVVERYMNSIEEIINIPALMERYRKSVDAGKLADVLDELLLQAKLEFNIEDDVSETSGDAA